MNYRKILIIHTLKFAKFNFLIEKSPLYALSQYLYRTLRISNKRHILTLDYNKLLLLILAFMQAIMFSTDAQLELTILQKIYLNSYFLLLLVNIAFNTISILIF